MAPVPPPDRPDPNAPRSRNQTDGRGQGVWGLGRVARDLVLAGAFLTRLPLPRVPMAPINAVVWAFPVVGGLIGSVAGGILALAGPVLGADAAAVLVVTATLWLTGALHEDGLADTADGLGGGLDRARKLAIMKDSRIGTYGVCALILALGFKVILMARLSEAGGGTLGALIAAGAVSRTVLVILMRMVPPARPDGASAAAGQPGRGMTVLTLLTGLGLAAIAMAWGGPGLIAFGWALCAGAVPTCVLALITWRHIRGQTGDSLGASQVSMELGFLAGCAALLAP